MNPSYIKADGNLLINEKCIRWVRKIDECLEVCTKSNGCGTTWVGVGNTEIHKICKINNPDSYDKLNFFFQENK